jgi:urease gamma subunit
MFLEPEDDVELLAKHLHEAGREAVERGLVVNKLGIPFLGWDEITEDAREGRRVMARYLRKHYAVWLKGD